MTTTMQLIAKQTVGAGGASSVIFSNIPQTYTDLKLVTSFRGASSLVNESFYIYPNGSSSNGTRIAFYGTGSGAGAETFANIRTDYFSAASATASVFGAGDVYIFDYTSSGNKSMAMEGVAEGMTGAMYMAMSYGRWSNSAAITSLEIVGLNGNISEFSTFYLYGISNNTTTQASTVPYASGGDVITTDGSYWYHAFKYSGSFTPLKNLTTDVLVIAGGGGGGNNYSAGSGAGGLRLLSAQALTSSTNYTCTIGAGGAASATGNNGSNSSFTGSGFTTISATGGGKGSYGGSGGLNSGSSGGSGGGNNAGGTGFAGNVGGYTPVEGYAGGNSGGSPNGGQGGGGGAGGVGGNGTNTTSPANGGNGGVGFYNSITNAMGSATSTGQLSGGNYYYAGGGGGAGWQGTAGTGGLGGGGNAGAINGGTGVSGTANTGGGGGGGSINSYDSGSGGSGIIIVRYAV